MFKLFEATETTAVIPSNTTAPFSAGLIPTATCCSMGLRKRPATALKEPWASNPMPAITVAITIRNAIAVDMASRS